jgi:hypothetical protein
MLQIDILYIVSGGLTTDRDILIVVEIIQYIVSGGHATGTVKIYCRWWTRYLYR